MTPVRDNQLFVKISEMLGGQKPVGTRIEKEHIRQWIGFTLDCEISGEQKSL